MDVNLDKEVGFVESVLFLDSEPLPVESIVKITELSEDVVERCLEILKDVNGILVAGGFGSRGVEGKILAINYARKNKIPFLGICLGMQLLFDKSEEFGNSDGLGLISGKVIKFNESKFDKALKIPHMGWNTLKFTKQTPINSGLSSVSLCKMPLLPSPASLEKMPLRTPTEIAFLTA